MTHINTRRDLASEWASANPVLQAGERGYEIDTRKSKTGDGVTAWNSLGYEVAAISATKADVGLGSVDNTSDMDKPVSTAQAAALATRAPLDSPALTGNPTAPTPLATDNDTSLATTAMVQAAIQAALAASSRAAQPGDFKTVASRQAPSGWLKCDGSAVSRTTYANLFNAIVPSMGPVTITIASPGVVTKAAHGLSTGDSVYFTTTGALPTGLSPNTLYYVIRTGTGTFQLATTRTNAFAGVQINTSGSQSGTHTMFDCPYGLGDGSTTFNVPDARGRTLAGMDTDAGTAAGRLTLPVNGGSPGNLGASGGEQQHTMLTSEMPSHNHGLSQIKYVTNFTTTGATTALTGAGTTITQTTDNAGGGTPHNVVQPTLVGNVVIKT